MKTMKLMFGAHHRYALLLMLILLFAQGRCDDEEDHLLQGINSFRQSLNVPTLSKHVKADCVADEIADQLEGRSCTSSVGPPAQSQLLAAYPDVLRKCKVDINSTTEGMIIPVCVPHRVATLVMTNYTQSQNSMYVNSTRYTGAGIGKEDDWTVLVLTTTTPAGSFTNGVGFCMIALFNYLVPVVLIQACWCMCN